MNSIDKGDLPSRVCRVLETLVVDEITACRVLETLTADEITSDEPFEDTVYRFTHIANGRCENPHEDWVKEFEELEKSLYKLL